MTTEKIDLFLSQLNNAVPQAAVDIIKTITEMPGFFVFGELLDHPTIQALRNTQHHMFYELLELFCYGSFKSLEYGAPKFPELSPDQLRKLKQLAIIEEAHTSRFIPYELLLQNLKVASHRELEDLIIDLFYLGAISGKLDQQKAILEVEYAIGRDIRAGEILDLNGVLDTSSNRVRSVLENMANEILLANGRRAEAEKAQKKAEEEANSLKEAMRLQMSRDAADNMCMDVDEDMLRHGDFPFDGRRGSRMSMFPGLDAYTGDRDPRGRVGFGRNLRRKQ